MYHGERVQLDLVRLFLAFLLSCLALTRGSDSERHQSMKATYPLIRRYYYQMMYPLAWWSFSTKRNMQWLDSHSSKFPK